MKSKEILNTSEVSTQSNKFSKWDGFKFRELKEDNYGLKWPPGTQQITKELKCFDLLRFGKSYPGMLTAFDHFLNCVRMLLPNVELYKDISYFSEKKGKYLNKRVVNNHFLDIAEELCSFEDVMLTGPASASKTFCAAVYALISFLSRPNGTLAMISTTSGSGAERRIWADIKEMHSSARYKDCGIQQIGELVNHKMMIVFDPEKELGGAKKNNRDERNAIQVIPIARDSSGDAALSTIQGSKNTSVIWVIDEMAHMQQGITRPFGNLVNNEKFQLIGIANASDPTDPHGRQCMPIGGLDALSVERDRRWTSATGKRVLFLHGEEGPNYHPFALKRGLIPFKYLGNRKSAEKAAIDYGYGNIEEGKRTSDYYKFQIGFWPPADASSSLFSANLMRSFNASDPHGIIIHGHRTFAGGDFAFTSGGDSNSFIFATFGYTQNGEKVINFSRETIQVKVKSDSREEFVELSADEYYKLLRQYNVQPQDFGCDVSNDGGLTINALSRRLGTYDIYAISSNGSAYNDQKYKKRITELWFQARDVIRTGLCRGINLNSKYCSQLFERRYTTIGSKVEVETKKDMKKRIGRSPDDADAFVYLCAAIIRSGIINTELSNLREVEKKPADPRQGRVFPLRRNEEDPEAYILASSDDCFDEAYTLETY